MKFYAGSGRYGFDGMHGDGTALTVADFSYFLIKGTVSRMLLTEINGLCAPGGDRAAFLPGYFFGWGLRKHLGKPIDFIDTYGGAAEERWISIEKLKRVTALASSVRG